MPPLLSECYNRQLVKLDHGRVAEGYSVPTTECLVCYKHGGLQGRYQDVPETLVAVPQV